MKIKILFFALFVSAVMTSNAQYNFGLRFKSKDVEKRLRTGLDLTSEGAITYENSFNIKFDLSFRSYEGFGYILRLKELNSNQQIDLICKLDEVSPGLYLVINGKEAKSRIRLEKTPDNPSNSWNSVELGYDKKSGQIKLVYNKEKIMETISFPLQSQFVLGFGVVNKYGFDTSEVPFISIRSVSVITDGTEKHHWLLEHQGGESPIDNIGGKKALITNPEWEIYYHSKWTLLRSFKLREKPQIAYDQESEKIFMVCDNQKIYNYDLKNNRLDSITYSGFPPANEKDNQLIVGPNSQLQVYSHQVNKISRYDWNEHTWNPQFKNNDSLPIYWHHNKLINPINNKITTLCGYGFYTYKSSIIEFNDSLNQWVKTHFSGDSIFPRYLSALGQNPKNKNQYYLFGGLGNKTGDQLLGTQFYYDLYLIDFQKKTIKRIWQLDYKGLDNITPVNSLIVDTENNCFYTLCFSHNDEKSYLKIIKASLTKPEYEFLGDSIPYYFIDIQSYADLYYWRSKRELVAITSFQTDKSSTEVKIYTIQFPPGSLSDSVQSASKINSGIVKLFVLFIVLLLCVAGYVLYRYRKKQLVSGIDSRSLDENNNFNSNNQIKTEILKPGSINLFGGFQAIDKKGHNITYRFSPTLRELLILMLLNSCKDCKGISTFLLNETLWPNKSSLSAKNNRGVNVAKLRNILEDIGDIKIIHENSFWNLQFGDGAFCDYYFIHNILIDTKENKFLEPVILSQMIKYLKRGDFLVNVNSEWLDKYKAEISTLIVQFFETQLEKANIEFHSNLMLEISNVIFLFDQLNETALKYKCKVLNLMGDHGLALKTYTDYASQYNALYGEDFKYNFKQVLKN